MVVYTKQAQWTRWEARVAAPAIAIKAESDAQRWHLVERIGEVISSRGRPLSRAASLMRARLWRSAGSRDRDYVDSIPKWFHARPEYIYDTRTGRRRDAISQIAIAARQAKGDPAVFAVASRADDGRILSLHTAAAGLLNGSGKGLGLD